MQAKKIPAEAGENNHEPEVSLDPGVEATRKAALIAALAERGWVAVERANGDFAVRHSQSSWRRRVRGLDRLEIVARHICGADAVRAICGAEAPRPGGAER